MKKISYFLLCFVIAFSFAGCSNDQSATNENAADGNQMSNGEMAWTVKEAIYTYPSGETTICYSGELGDVSFIMSYLEERRRGEVDRSSMIFEYDSNGITKIRTEEQDYGKEVDDESEITLTYDEATSTLIRLTVEDGKEASKKTYVITWDEQERLAAYDLTESYYYYNDDGTLSEENKYEYKYTYQYEADSFAITCDEKQEVSVDDEYVEAIKRTVSTIPYEEKGDIETVTSYFKTDGTTPLNIGWGDKKTVMEKAVSNWWGYETSHIIYYSDGTQESNTDVEYTFDEEGRILKKVSESYKNGIVIDGEEPEMAITTINFTYDENGNLTKIERDYDGEITILAFEWMQIPARLDDQIAMLFGVPHWSVAEYIDNYIRFNGEGSLTERIYKKSDFLTYVN